MSEKYKETDRMGDIICDDYRILQVISRFGLTLGFGDHTVSETCLAAGVDAPTFFGSGEFHTFQRADVESVRYCGVFVAHGVNELPSPFP